MDIIPSTLRRRAQIESLKLKRHMYLKISLVFFFFLDLRRTK